ACGSPQPSQPESPKGGSADAYAECLRSHGLVMEEYTAEDGSTRSRPDKTRNDIQAINDAVTACVDLLPTDDPSSTAAPSAEALATRLRSAACIREHGVTEFPDPDPATGDFPIDEAVKYHPSMRTAMEACRSMLPGSDGPGTVGG